MLPPLLQKNDTIGIVSLGSPIHYYDIEKGIELLTNLGYHISLGKAALSQSFPASSAIERATDLTEMIHNPHIKMILSSRGGTGVADILPYLNYKVVKKHPKIIAGYSDVSILLNVITQLTGLITYNTPMLQDIRQDTPSFNLEKFIQGVSTPTVEISNPPHMPLINKVRGQTKGPIIGGNLTSIVGSIGTPYEINTKGKILFLEDVNENSPRMYRLLTHLIRAGKLEDVRGIIMGECTNCKPEYNTTYDQVINQLLVPLGKPLLTNLATGHGQYKVTIPIGSVVSLDTVNGEIRVVD